MATTRALAATGEQIAKTELTVTSALDIPVVVYLPGIDASTGALDGQSYSIFANAKGKIEVRKLDDSFVALIPAGCAFQFTANEGDDTWAVSPLPGNLVATPAFATNGAVTPTLGANAPTGTTTASSKWMKIVGQDGVTYVFPVWTSTL